MDRGLDQRDIDDAHDRTSSAPEYGNPLTDEAGLGHPEKNAAVRNIRFPERSNYSRVNRWQKEQVILQDAMSAVLRANVTMVNCGSDPALDKVAEQLGFRRFDLVTVRALFGTKTFSIVCVPIRIWKKPHLKRKLLQMKFNANTKGNRLVLAPASSVLNNQRHKNAVALSLARGLKPTASERRKILRYLHHNKSSSLEDCAKLIPHHKNPLGVVLHLVLYRWLCLAPGPIGPATLVTASDSLRP